MAQVTTLAAALQEIQNRTTQAQREKLIADILRGEGLAVENQHEQDITEEEQEVMSQLQQKYEALNFILSVISDSMGRSRQLNEWNDSQPLEEMLRLFPGIHNTKWWDFKMNQVLGF